MASGVISGVTSNKYIVGALTWSATSDNKENCSDIVATLRYSRTNSYLPGTIGTWSGGITIDGETFTGTQNVTITQDSNTFAMSASKRVYHDSDGKKSITISAYGNAAVPGWTYTTLSGVAVLDSIPRAASIIVASDFNDEESFVNLVYSNPAGNNVDSLQACLSLDKAEMIVPYKDISTGETTCRFELGEVEKNLLYNATLSGSNERLVYYGLKTVIGGVTYEEWSPKKFSVVNAKPVLHASVVKIEDSTDEYFSERLIQSYSDVTYEMDVEAVKGASIVSQKVVCGAISSSELAGVLENVESGEFIFSAVDNRGNEVILPIKISMLPYDKLTCNLTIDGPDGNGTMNLSISGAVSSLETLNEVSVYVCYKTSGSDYSDWIQGTVQEIDWGQGRYSATATIEGLDYSKKYFVKAKVVDLIDEKESAEVPAIAIPVFDWSENDFNFNVPVTVQGMVLVNPYPVGSIWMTVSEDNPKDLFGGVWEKIEGRFLLGSGGEYLVGNSGGSSVISIEDLPSNIVINGYRDGFSWFGGTAEPNGDLYYKNTEATEHMPPYIVVHIWKRVE